MNNKDKINSIKKTKTYKELLFELNKSYYEYLTNKGQCLSEKDFYPAQDNRTLTSYIEDIEDGDNFADYCKYIFDLYEENGCYD